MEEEEKNRVFSQAIHYESVAELKELISGTEQKCDEIKPYGQTLLGHTVNHGNLAAAELLLQWGCDVNGQDDDGATPLLTAIRKGDLKMTRFFLEKGGDPNCYDNFGNTPLKVAIYTQFKFPEFVRELLTWGADPLLEDGFGQSGLLLAKKYKLDDIYRMLISAL